MKVFYTYSPEKNPDVFFRAVSSFSSNANHDLTILCSTDSEAEALDFAASLYEFFSDVDVIAKSFPSPKKESEYGYFESRIVSSLYVKFPNLGPALFLGRNDVPTADGWCNTISNLILSSGKALTGYGKPYRNGMLYPDSLLTNGFFNTFQLPRSFHSSTYFRAAMRFEAIHDGVTITDDIIPLSCKPCEISKADADKLAESRNQLAEIKAAAKAKRDKAVTNYDDARQSAGRRVPTERALIQPAPPQGSVTTFGPAFAEKEKIDFPESAPSVVETSVVLAPEQPTVATNANAANQLLEAINKQSQELKAEPVKVDPPKAVKKVATKKARKAPTKKSARKTAKKSK